MLRSLLLVISLLLLYTAAADDNQCKGNDSFECIRSLAKRGDAVYQYRLGSIYWNGEYNTFIDKQAAVQWYRKAAEQGVAEAQFYLGVAYRLGEGVAEDHREAVAWFRQAAEQGHARAQHNLGVAYYIGKGVAEDHREAVAWFRQAAEQGDANAQHNLGIVYATGEGVAVDHREAARWYRQAAEQGLANAQYNLGVAYRLGEGVAVDRREAVHWYRQAAEQGHARAQYSLGVAYGLGEGVAVDHREAVRWYRLAAEQGLAIAQYNLGYAYDTGEGVTVDHREAVRWYRLAAEQGDADAQYNLGIAYATGEGVTVDHREAVRWVRQSAEQGYVNAQYNLGVSYWSGQGVIEDKREAYIWFSIAKANGSEAAANALRTAKWNRYLTLTEFKTARREAATRLEDIKRRQAEAVKESATITAGEMLSVVPPQAANSAAAAFENIWRSVVVVKNDRKQGSGVIIRPDKVATNCHVIDGGGDNVVYKHDNRHASTDTLFATTVILRDQERDFCVLGVSDLRGSPVQIRRYHTLNIGEAVYALGAPQGLDLSLSAGVISQLRQGDDSSYIQTDAAISPGSSGGGLFDAEGKLIGILTSQIYGEGVEGIGFAIPADLALGL